MKGIKSTEGEREKFLVILALCSDLLLANDRVRKYRGYTGKSIHKESYWIEIAEILIQRGWNKSK